MLGVYLVHRNTRIAGLHTADDQRVQDILSLSWRVVFFSKTRGRLPSSLSEISESDWSIPADPVTSSPYFYEALGPDTFRLCAIFFSASNNADAGSPNFLPSNARQESGVLYGDPVTHSYGSWAHGAGRQCLDRKAELKSLTASG